MPSSQTSSPFHRLIVSEWGTATSVLLLALEVTWVSPACGSLLQASSCVAELTSLLFFLALPREPVQTIYRVVTILECIYNTWEKIFWLWHMGKIITIHLSRNVMDYPSRCNRMVKLLKAYIRWHYHVHDWKKRQQLKWFWIPCSLIFPMLGLIKRA